MAPIQTMRALRGDTFLNTFQDSTPKINSAADNTSSPNKFFESLAAGIPVIQNTNGWMKDFLHEHEVGFTLNPDDPKALADLMITLDSRKEELQAIEIKAKQLAREQFDKNILADKMLNAIKRCLQPDEENQYRKKH